MRERRSVSVVVRGRVQGVFFRVSCRRAALDAGVAGWVANRPDGAVEAEFEGTPAAVQRMLTWCREGPPGASVTSIEVTETSPRGMRGFTIGG